MISDVQVADALDLLRVPEQEGDLAAEFLELLDADDHLDLLPLRGLQLDDDLGPQHLVQVVRREHHVDLPLAGDEVEAARRL